MRLDLPYIARTFCHRGAMLLLTVTVCGLLTATGQAAEYASHPPMRPLPEPSQRPLADGPIYFVDAERGDDTHDGSKAKPWKSISHALAQLRPGDTLCLRGGTYYESVDVPVSGTEEKPLTIRSYPGELAIIDGGLREFFDDPAHAWKSADDGVPGEFVSTSTFPLFDRRPVVHNFPAAGWEPFHGKFEERPIALGHFGDSMVPLHGYRTRGDLQDDSMLWDVDSKFDNQASVYCGPGLWFNRRTDRIHVRLAHCNLAGLGDRAYRGVTDPRKLPLVISLAYGEDVLRLNGIRHVQFQDLVLRGASGSPLVNLYSCEGITFDGVTFFGGSPGLLVKTTAQLRIVNSAFRGLAAPWSSRASMKYRGTPSYTIITQRNLPQNHDFEFAHNEFTDNHDGLWIRYVKNLRFHHNFVDHFNDDGLEFGAKKRDHEIYIYQNLISRCLLTLTLHEMAPDESPVDVDPGSGVYITRNVIDLRRGLFKSHPKEPDPKGEYLARGGTLCGDHGGPTWPHYYFYHNTVIRPDTAWRGYYGFGIGGRGLRNTQRRVFNNVFVQLTGIPGLNITPEPTDLFIDGNLHWGVQDGPEFTADFFKTQGRAYGFRNTEYPSGWMEHDQFADPKFERLSTEIDGAMDLRLREGSPAINAGVDIPAAWHDPLRAEDAARPDLGAIPRGVAAWNVGINGRISVFGDSRDE